MASLKSTRTLTRPLLSATTLPLRTLTINTPQNAFFSTTHIHSVKIREQVAGRYGGVPPYPYGYRPWYRKSNFGLYGEARVRFGNNVSERNEIKTRRRWYPNVQRKRLWSVSLNRFVRTRVTTRVLRTIDKVGGLDEYLLGETAARIKELGPGGWALRWRIMRTDSVRARYAEQRRAMGLTKGVNGLPYVAPTPEEDVGLGEEELVARERAIDAAIDADMERDAKGEDGGVELESFAEEEIETAPKRSPKTSKRETVS